MNQKVKNAITKYCSMLPYPNSSSQSNDDSRLYEISFYLAKCNENLDDNFFRQELRKNSQASLDNLNDSQFNDFAKNRIIEINGGKYILVSLSNLIFDNHTKL